MSDKNCDLPGFYRDPITGKYFRDNPAAAKNRSLEKLKKENENRSKISRKPTNYSKYSNIFKFLQAREIGCLPNDNIERRYCQMTVSSKELINEYSLNRYEPGNIIKVNYIRGTPNFVLGVWTANEMSKFENSVITNQFFNPHHMQRLLFRKVYAHYITDLCEGPNMTINYIFNNQLSERGGIVCLELQSSEVNVDVLYAKSLSNFPLYCCTSSTTGEHTAVGSLRSVLYYDHEAGESYRLPVLNSARVHTISFNDSSNLMVMGTHTGHMLMRDMRTHEIVADVNVSKYCINESYFLEPDQVIVAGLENVLCAVDLRMNEVITEYFGHKTSTKKSALSYANNMLCATGVDNVIRIWHVDGGNPIQEMYPCASLDNNIRGWLFNEADKTYLYHFEAGFRKTFFIAT